MKKFFREWGRRCVYRFSLYAVVAPVVFLFVMIRDGLDRTDLADWVVIAVLTVLALICGKTAWDDPEVPPPTPAQLRQSRLAAVADTVSDLPGGIRFEELCLQLDEKQTRRLLHLLHQIRPGERHLRDVLPKVR